MEGQAQLSWNRLSAVTPSLKQIMLFDPQDVARRATAGKLWAGRALAFGMVTAATAVILLCPCDNPGRSSRSIVLIALSAIFGCAAAFLIYRELQARNDITRFLKIVISLAIAAAAVYIEFTIATDVIEWLARPR